MKLSMSTELTLLTTKTERKDPTRWCVYFDEETGDLVTVTSKPHQNIEHPFLRTTSDDARKVLMGIEDPRKFAVVDLSEGYKLIERGDVVRIREAENYLTNIPINNDLSYDVNIIFYINSWKMEVNFSQETLYKMTGRRKFREVKINPEKDGKYDKITLYLIKENDPNFLIETIDIDPAQLIVDGYNMYDMSKLRNVCGLGEVRVMTRKIFKSYGMKRKLYFGQADFVSRLSKRRNEVQIKQQSEDISTTFTIIKKDNNQHYLKSNFDNPHETRIYSDLILYYTPKKNPNQLLGYIHVPIKEIGYQKEYYISSEHSFEDCSFLCRAENNNITFDYASQEILNA